MVRRRVCPAALRPSGAFAPAGLGPELVPGVEVLEVLPTVSHLAVLELEDDQLATSRCLPPLSAVLRWIPTTRLSPSAAMCCNSARKVPPVSCASWPKYAKVAPLPW